MPPRRARSFLTGAVLAALLYVGARRVGPVPALGGFLDPANGVWALARSANLPVRAAARIPGLTAPVEVLYDDRGVPHVFAATEEDAWRAEGFVVARDRLFQLELQTRAADRKLRRARERPDSVGRIEESTERRDRTHAAGADVEESSEDGAGQKRPRAAWWHRTAGVGMRNHRDREGCCQAGRTRRRKAARSCASRGSRSGPTQPHQLSVGIAYVFVNGTLVAREGAHTGAIPGRIMRGPGRPGSR